MQLKFFCLPWQGKWPEWEAVISHMLRNGFAGGIFYLSLILSTFFFFLFTCFSYLDTLKLPIFPSLLHRIFFPEAISHTSKHIHKSSFFHFSRHTKNLHLHIYSWPEEKKITTFLFPSLRFFLFLKIL